MEPTEAGSSASESGLQARRALPKIFMKCARRAATQRNYSSGARKYIKFCGFLDANPFVPISEENLAMCAILFCHDCSVHTLASRLSAVENFCRLEKLPKLPKGTDYYEVVAGLKNIYGQVDI